jgi:hypothetical protein
MSKESEQRAHDRGERDASNGKFETPHYILTTVVSDEALRENNAYQQGWRNTNDQIKHSK